MKIICFSINFYDLWIKRDTDRIFGDGVFIKIIYEDDDSTFNEIDTIGAKFNVVVKELQKY